MNVSNEPTYVYFFIDPDLRPYFDVVLLVFAICFFVGVHYSMHVQQHCCPPFYILWLRKLWSRFWK